MKPRETVALAEGEQAVDTATRRYILLSLGLALNFMGEGLRADLRAIMQQLRQELWVEAFGELDDSTQMIFSAKEMNAAVTALTLVVGLSYIPLGDMPTHAQVARRHALAGLRALFPLLDEERRLWDQDELECIQYQLRDLGVDEVKAKR